MKQFNRYLMILAMVFTSFASARVVEISRMAEITPHITQESWVVFDLDNTVMEPVQTLGSDQWFEHMVKTLGNLDKAIEIWSKVQTETLMQPVEPSTPALIRNLQRKGLRVFALTARPASLHDVTTRQLARLGVRFGKIISVGPTTSKGEALVNEIRSSATSPTSILFVDDKQKHVKSVDEALSGLGLSDIEFRYGAADPKVHAFDSAIADLQLGYFEVYEELLSDAEAKAILEKSAEPSISSPEEYLLD